MAADARSSEAAPTEQATPTWIARIERLSMDVRGKRLSLEERSHLSQELVAKGGRSVYESTLDAWLMRDFFRRAFVPRTVRNDVRSLFIDNLVRRQSPSGEAVYALPGDVPEAGGTCAAAEQRSVRPWWAPDREIKVCAGSYRPETSFDDVGYCAGQPDPKTGRAPRRPNCGCGPLLIACLPPHDEGGIDDELGRAARDEVVETAAFINDANRPYDELLTTTKTWQSGLVEFLYARRRIIGELSEKPPSPVLEKRWLSELRKIDLARPAAFTARQTPYVGAGILLSTPQAEATFDTYRTQMRAVLGFVCSNFDGVGVDRDNLLRVVGTQHANVRAIKVHESPMRSQVGCSGCHAPMDYGAAFLVGIRTQLLGAHPTSETAEGKLYVNGAQDYRGSGVGFGDLMTLVTKQPEFAPCTVDRAFVEVVGRKASPREHALRDELVEEFRSNGHVLKPVVRRLFLSEAYLSPESP